jgi:hypothetical protein
MQGALIDQNYSLASPGTILIRCGNHSYLTTSQLPVPPSLDMTFTHTPTWLFNPAATPTSNKLVLAELRISNRAIVVFGSETSTQSFALSIGNVTMPADSTPPERINCRVVVPASVASDATLNVGVDPERAAQGVIETVPSLTTPVGFSLTCASCTFVAPTTVTLTGSFGLRLRTRVAILGNVTVTAGSLRFLLQDSSSRMTFGSITHTSTASGAEFALATNTTLVVSRGVVVNLTQGTISIGAFTTVDADVTLAAQAASIGSGAIVQGSVTLAPPVIGGTFTIQTGPLVYDLSQQELPNLLSQTVGNVGCQSTAPMRLTFT